MRVLITGGAGFIGSHLAESMLADGHRVSIIDDLSTGSLENFEHLKTNDKFNYHIDTIFNEDLVATLVGIADVVFHLAAAVGVYNIVQSPVRSIQTNVRGSEVVLALAAEKRKRILLTSTSEVYGKSNKFPFSEDDDLVLGPTYKTRWSYACSKAIDEFLALAYYHEQKLPVTVVRLFNTVGPRQSARYGMVLPKFVSQALSSQELTVFGTGKQSRCFVHVDDIVRGIRDCVATDKSIGQVFNLGSTEEITINDLAARVINATDSVSGIKHIPYSEAYQSGFEDMQRRVPDIAKAQRMFGFEPTKSLDEIIASVIDWVQARTDQESHVLV